MQTVSLTIHLAKWNKRKQDKKKITSLITRPKVPAIQKEMPNKKLQVEEEDKSSKRHNSIPGISTKGAGANSRAQHRYATALGRNCTHLQRNWYQLLLSYSQAAPASYPPPALALSSYASSSSDVSPDECSVENDWMERKHYC